MYVSGQHDVTMTWYNRVNLMKENSDSKLDITYGLWHVTLHIRQRPGDKYDENVITLPPCLHYHYCL